MKYILDFDEVIFNTTALKEKMRELAIPESERGLDVFEKEPKVPEALFDMANVVLTPHVASATQETRQAMSDLVVENLITFFEKGAPVAPVPESDHLLKS